MSTTSVTRKIGDAVVPAIGYGAMGIAAFYGKPQPDEERFKVGNPVNCARYRALLTGHGMLIS